MTKTLEEWQEIQANKLEQAWTRIATLERRLAAANKRNADLQRLLDQERKKSSAENLFRGLE